MPRHWTSGIKRRRRLVDIVMVGNRPVSDVAVELLGVEGYHHAGYVRLEDRELVVNLIRMLEAELKTASAMPEHEEAG